jgi:hypothetical protein
VIQAELSIQIGQALAQLKAASAAVADFGKTAGAGMGASSAGADQANKAHGGLLQTMREEQKEARQASRMAKFWSTEITDLIPAAEGAKGAIRGMIGVAAEGMIGGVGIGLAIAGVQLLVQGFMALGEGERKAAAEAAEFATSLGKQTAEIWKNVDALRAKREHVPDFQFEADTKLNERRENLGGSSLLEKQVELRRKMAALDAGFEEHWKGRQQYDEAGASYDKALIAHKREQLALGQQLSQVEQAIIPIQIEREEKRLVWAREFNALQAKGRADGEADQRRIYALAGSEGDRITADETNKRIEAERRFNEEKEKGTANQANQDQVLANIENEANERRKKLRQGIEAANAALAAQIKVLEADGEVEKSVATWQSERLRIQTALRNGTLEASTAQLQLNLADAQYLDGLKKIAAAEDKRKLDEAQARGLQDALTDPGEAGGMDVSKTPTQVNEQATKNAAHAIKNYNQQQQQAIDGAAQWGDAMGTAVGGIITGTVTVAQAFAQMATMVVKSLVDIAIKSVTANAATAASGAASSQAGIPIVGPALGIAAMGAMLVAVLGLLGNIGAKELGGSVFPGTYLVGEAGPELLRLGGGLSGSVVPNHKLAMAAGSLGDGAGPGVGMTINITAFDGQDVERVLTRHDGPLYRVINRGRRAGRV